MHRDWVHYNDEGSALRLAYYRLRYPASLREAAEEQYAAFLRENLSAALYFALRERDGEGLRLLLGLGEPDPAALDTALDEARAFRYTEATAILLEKRRQRPAAGRSRIP